VLNRKVPRETFIDSHAFYRFSASPNLRHYQPARLYNRNGANTRHAGSNRKQRGRDGAELHHISKPSSDPAGLRCWQTSLHRTAQPTVTTKPARVAMIETVMTFFAIAVFIIFASIMIVAAFLYFWMD
jgi:hypothetical protein